MDTIYLVGAAQGVFLAAVLASRRRNALPNRLLAGLMLVFSLDLAMAVYHASAASVRHPGLIGLDLPVAFLYGPLLYLYVRTFTAGETRLRKKDMWHLVPFALCVVFLLPFFARSGPEKLALLHDPSLSLVTQALAIINPLKLLHGAVYLGLVGLILRRHGPTLVDLPADRARRRWLRSLTTGVVVMLGLSVLFYVLGGNDALLGMDPAGRYDDLTLLLVTVFVYAIGYLGLRQPESLPPSEETLAAAPAADRVPYARSGMTAEEAEQHRARLVTVMETEHLYRRGDLTLQELADALGITPHNLTEVLSTRLDQSFYDFVNGYRVREVQARLHDPTYAAWTVLAIGLEAGFNAKSSFNAAFKRHTGMTPSQYRRTRAEVA